MERNKYELQRGVLARKYADILRGFEAARDDRRVAWNCYQQIIAASDAMRARGEMGYEEFCQHLELCTEKVVVVHLADGDTITTRIHGAEQDIRAYYRVGSMLNMGAESDRLVEIVGVDIMEPPGNAPHGPVNELQRPGVDGGG